MCERRAENYSAGTCLVIISYTGSPLLKMVQSADTEHAELGLVRFEHSVKELD